MNSQPHIRLFDQVEIALNAVGSKFKPSVEADGVIHFSVLDSEGGIVTAGRVTFNVFWSNQRHNRALFDREILEQLIIKRVQDYQNEHSLVPIRIERVELDELRALQQAESTGEPNLMQIALDRAQTTLGPLTELGRLGQFAGDVSTLGQDNAYTAMQSKPMPFPCVDAELAGTLQIGDAVQTANGHTVIEPVVLTNPDGSPIKHNIKIEDRHFFAADPGTLNIALRFWKNLLTCAGFIFAMSSTSGWPLRTSAPQPQ